jgi:hypothetical protein
MRENLEVQLYIGMKFIRKSETRKNCQHCLTAYCDTSMSDIVSRKSMNLIVSVSRTVPLLVQASLC